MNRRRLNYKYFIVIGLVLFISMGYAYLTSTLRITGLGHVKKTTWNIYFDNVDILKGSSLATTLPTTSKNYNTTSISYTVNFNIPGDVFQFNVDVVNNGTIDAMISLVDNTVLTADQLKYAEYSITYSDGAQLQEKNFLGAHSKDTITVTVSYKKDIEVSDLLQEVNSINFSLGLTYVQAKGADARENVSTIVTDLSSNGNDGIIYGAKINQDGTVTTDGVDDYINCGLSGYDFGNSASLVMRIKYSNISSGAKQLLDNYQFGGFGIALESLKFRTEWHVNGAYVRFTSNFEPITDTWYTVVGTYDGSKIKLYVNGNAVALLNDASTYEVVTSGNITKVNYPMLIAANPDNGSVNELSAFTVSDALIFDRALTAEEVATDYATYINPTNTTDLLLYYKFSNS